MTTNVHYLKWVRLDRYCELTGEPVKSVINRITSGRWLKDIHWKVVERRRWINIIEAQDWVENEGKRAWR